MDECKTLFGGAAIGPAPAPAPGPVATLPPRPVGPLNRPPAPSSVTLKPEPPFSSNILKKVASGLGDGWRALASDLAAPDAAAKLKTSSTSSEFTARAQQYRALQAEVEESKHYAELEHEKRLKLEAAVASTRLVGRCRLTPG